MLAELFGVGGAGFACGFGEPRGEGFLESLGLRPLDVGGLTMAHWLEGASLVEMGLAVSRVTYRRMQSDQI